MQNWLIEHHEDKNFLTGILTAIYKDEPLSPPTAYLPNFLYYHNKLNTQFNLIKSMD